MRILTLTDRLRAIAAQVRGSARSVADIGTDHGYVPVWLIQNGHTGRIILSDINSGPLERAAESFRRYVPGIKPDLRQGSGLNTIRAGEAEVIIIAGMGGNLITDILSEGVEAAESASQIILQPGRHVSKVRKWLRSDSAPKGFDIVCQIPVREGRRYCEIIVLVRKELLRERDAELMEACREAEASSGLENDVLDEVPAMYPVMYNIGLPADDGADIPGFIDFKIRLESVILDNIDKNGRNAEAAEMGQKLAARLEGFKKLRGMLKQ